MKNSIAFNEKIIFYLYRNGFHVVTDATNNPDESSNAEV